MKRMTRRSAVIALALALGACGASTSLGDLLLGTWSLAGYSDHGAEGVTTGTWTFGADGTFGVLGTVTYPGEPTDSLRVSGTWQLYSPTTIELVVGSNITIWQATVVGDTAALALSDSTGVVRITLVRPGAAD